MKKIAFAVFVFMIIIGLLYPILTPYAPEDFSFEPLIPPGSNHILGTNAIGQDIFSAILAGFRSSVWIGILSGGISTIIGTVLAIACAYWKGNVDKIIIKTTELFIIVPEIVVIMLFSVFAGNGINSIIFAISFFSWSKVTRIVRAKANIAIYKESVQYTLLMKGNIFDVLKKMWPSIRPAIFTMFMLQCSKAVLYEASLSFLGIGDPTIKSWGRIIRQALDYEGLLLDNSYLWWLIPPMVCIMIFVSAISFIGFDFDEEN